MSNNSNKPTVLVTGAAGFVGARVVEVLHLTGVAEVKAGIRQWSSAGAARLARFPIDMVFCDVTQKDQIERAMEGVDIVIHSVLGDGKVNVDGTRNLLEVAHKHGVKRFVHLSTAEVYGEPSGEVPETTPYGIMGWEYSDSKIDAEKACWEYYEKGLPISILRPSIIYGPYSQTWIIRFYERLSSGKWGIFKGLADGYCNLIYVDDLVSGIWLAATHEKAVGEAFNMNGPELVTWNEYFRRFNDALGLPPLEEVSEFKARARATAMEAARETLVFAKNHMGEGLKRRLIGGTRKTAAGRTALQARSTVRSAPPLRELLHLYNRDAVYVTTKAQELIGYKPRVDVDTALKTSVQWLDHNGLLPDKS